MIKTLLNKWAFLWGLVLGLIDAQLPGRNRNWSVSFTITNAALAKVLVDTWAPQVDAAISGETALPNESGVRQRVFTGGQRVIDGYISSTDGTARSIVFWLGVVTSLYANMGTVSTTVTNVLNRTLGSFITDGYVVGDTIMLFGCPTTGNNGVLCIVTGVTATTLTVNGTPFTNEAMAAGFRVIKVSQWTRRGIPLNSGNTDTAPPVQLLGGAQDPAQNPVPDAGLSLGPNDVLICGMTAAISALPATIQVRATSVLY